jgi:hypothetical protein
MRGHPADAPVVVIILRFQRDTGHPHSHRDAAMRNYAGLLSQLGWEEAAIRSAIESALRESGLG